MMRQQIKNFGYRIIMVASFLICWYFFKSVTDISILSKTHFVSNIDVVVRTYLEKFILEYFNICFWSFYLYRQNTHKHRIRRIRNNPVLKTIIFGNASIFPLLYRISLNYQLIGIRKIEYIFQNRLSVSDTPSSGEWKTLWTSTRTMVNLA